MDVSMVSSMSGIRTAVQRHDVTAHDVANVNTPGFEERRPHQAETVPQGVRITHLSATPNLDPRLSNTDLATEAGEQIQNKHTVAANVRAARVKDRMLGELIDLIG